MYIYVYCEQVLLDNYVWENNSAFNSHAVCDINWDKKKN